jgi:uncharacterized LabA/DUF88 family protein
MMPTKICVMIDGGYVRTLCKQSGKPPKDPQYIEKIAKACRIQDEVIHRIMFYDCGGFTGTARQPVSGQTRQFTANDRWLDDLSHKDLFSLRLGMLKFRGFVLNPAKIPYTPGQPLTDADFYPDFEQKGVDMRIGIDIANLSANHSVEVIALATNDTDCIPAMKHARRCGLQIALVCFPGFRPAPELLAHTDFRRDVQWPL